MDTLAPRRDYSRGEWFCLEVVIVPLFPADGGGGTVAGEDYGVVGEGEQLVLYAVQFCLQVATGEVCAAYALQEQGVAAEEKSCIGNIE